MLSVIDLFISLLKRNRENGELQEAHSITQTESEFIVVPDVHFEHERPGPLLSSTTSDLFSYSYADTNPQSPLFSGGTIYVEGTDVMKEIEFLKERVDELEKSLVEKNELINNMKIVRRIDI